VKPLHFGGIPSVDGMLGVELRFCGRLSTALRVDRWRKFRLLREGGFFAIGSRLPDLAFSSELD
jgi:hypothetical protein